MSFHVVCSPAENATNTSIAYANVVRDIYTFKQRNRPPAGTFHERFFGLVGHYLDGAAQPARPRRRRQQPAAAHPY